MAPVLARYIASQLGIRRFEKLNARVTPSGLAPVHMCLILPVGSEVHEMYDPLLHLEPRRRHWYGRKAIDLKHIDNRFAVCTHALLRNINAVRLRIVCGPTY